MGNVSGVGNSTTGALVKLAPALPDPKVKTLLKP